MARNTKLRHQNSQYPLNDISNDSNDFDRKQMLNNFADVKGNMKLSLKQLVIFWGGSLFFIFLAFYFGFDAGKRAGAIAVLDEAGEQMVRLELHTPLEPYPDLEETNLIVEPIPKKSIPVLNNQNQAVPPKIIEEKNTKIDFTLNAPLDSGRKIEEKIKNPPEQKFEEIYRGKDLFAPLPPKSVVNEKLIEKSEELQVEQAIAKVKPPAKVETPNIKTLVPKNGWYVQVAAAPTEQDGLRYYEKITSKGLKLSLEPASIKDRSFFRVLVGPYPNKGAAMEKRNEIRQQAGTSGEPFIREVR